jgi:hypothetical protein
MNDSEIILFGGDFGWLSDCFLFDVRKSEISKMECALKKPEDFFQGQVVHYNDKFFAVGGLDKDLHVFSQKTKKWFLLERWYVDW